MNIRSELVPGALSESAQMLDQAPQQMQEFEQVLENLRDTDQEAIVQLAAAEHNTRVGALGDARYLEKLQQAQQPEGVRRILDDVEAGHVRMRELISELRSGSTYSNQELLAIQTEVYDLSTNLQVSTRVITEVVSNVKQLLTQQV